MEKLTGMWGVGADDTKGKVSLITTIIHYIYIFIYIFCKVILGVFNLECAELAPNPLHFTAGEELSFR